MGRNAGRRRQPRRPVPPEETPGWGELTPAQQRVIPLLDEIMRRTTRAELSIVAHLLLIAAAVAANGNRDLAEARMTVLDGIGQEFLLGVAVGPPPLPAGDVLYLLGSMVSMIELHPRPPAPEAGDREGGP